MTRAKLVSDGDGHNYLIPLHKHSLFNKLLDKGDKTDDYEEFEGEFGDYRVGGDYEIYANFEKI